MKYFYIIFIFFLISCGNSVDQKSPVQLSSAEQVSPLIHEAMSNNAVGSGANGRLLPSDIYQHYNIPLTNGVPTYSSGQTIAIVDAPGTNSISTIVSDLNQFTSSYGPKSSQCANPSSSGNKTIYTCNGFNFTIINLNTDVANQSSSWDGETALDVQWSHALAPDANLILVIGNSSSNSNLATAIDTAASQPGVSAVSMSFGHYESSTSETSLNYSSTSISQNDGLFSHWTAKGIVFLASSGDGGNTRLYPAASPFVTSVGGTYIQNLTALNPALSSPTNPLTQSSYEAVWRTDTGQTVIGSGGGSSLYEPMPSYQTNFLNTSLAGNLSSSVVGSTYYRAIPDVSYNASTTTSPVTTVVGGVIKGVGGTSAGAPQWAGIVAQMADYYSRLPSAVPSTFTLKMANTTKYPFGFNSYLYTAYSSISSTAPFFDVTVGNNVTGASPNTGFQALGVFPCSTLCSAASGYDSATGLGVPIVKNLLSTLLSN
jgi:subtilase family serine protease